MPSFNKLTNVNLTVTTQGRGGRGGGCPNPTAGASGTCGVNTINYLPTSLNEGTQQWLPAGADGLYDPEVTSSYGYISGSAYATKVVSNGCPYDAVYFSGSATFPILGNDGTLNPDRLRVMFSLVTGSFSISGTASGSAWSMTLAENNTGSLDVLFGGGGAIPYHYDDFTSKNTLVGVTIGSGVSPFGRRSVDVYASGSLFSSNPPDTGIGFPYSLGYTFTISGQGILRAFGEGTGSVSQQTEYNCLYGTIPS